MGIGYYIIMALLVVFGAVGMINRLYQISEDGKNELLDNMYKNGDITEPIYKKYKFKK